MSDRQKDGSPSVRRTRRPRRGVSSGSHRRPRCNGDNDRCLVRTTSIHWYPRVGPGALSAWPPARGGFTCVGVRSAATSVAATPHPRNMPATTPQTPTIPLSAVSSPVRTGFGATPPSSSTKDRALLRRSTIRSTSRCPVRLASCRQTGSGTCIDRLGPLAAPHGSAPPDRRARMSSGPSALSAGSSPRD